MCEKYKKREAAFMIVNTKKIGEHSKKVQMAWFDIPGYRT